MSYRLPLKQQVNEKKLTATLVMIYVLITALLFLDTESDSKANDKSNFRSAYSQNNNSHSASVY